MTPQIIRIHSDNADFQQLEALGRNREKRRKLGLFMVEGVRAINLGLAHGWTFEALIFADGVPLSRWAEGVIGQANAARHFLVAPEGFDLLTERNEGSELLALLHLPGSDLNRLPVRSDLRAVLLDRPANPGNLGSIVRTCDAFGIHAVVTVGHAVDPYSREAIRASTGSLLSVPVVQLPGPAEVRSWLSALRERFGTATLVGSDEHGEQHPAQFTPSGPTILAAGNESSGLSATLRELCDVTLHIPMGGSASSLNVAVATSILLYELQLDRGTFADSTVGRNYD